MRWNRLDWLAVLGLCLIPIFYFAPVVFYGQTFYLHDISIDYVPLSAFNTQTIHQGELPLWNPYLDGGFPFAGQPESAPWYLLNLILLLPLPISTTHTWYILVHYMLAGAFTYLLVRCGLHLGRVPGLIAGLAFAFSGTMIAQLTNFTLVTTWVWMPIILLLFIRALEVSKVGYAVGAGVAMAVQISKSHTQMVLYTAGVLALYAFFVTGIDLRARKGIRSLIPMRNLLVVLVISAGLSAYQLFYTAELIQRSNRSGGITYAVMTFLSFPPLYLVKFLIPNFFGSFQHYAGSGNYPEMHAYAGILPLILTVVAWFRPKHWRVWFFTTLMVICLILSFGKFLPFPLYRVLPYVPLLNFFRVPSRWLFLATFCSAVLAAYGAQALVDGHGQKNTVLQSSRQRVNARVLFPVLVGLVMIGGAVTLWNTTDESRACVVCEQIGLFDNPRLYTMYDGLMEHRPDERDYVIVEPLGDNSPEAERQREREAFQRRVSLAYIDMQRSSLLFLLMLSLGLVTVLARWRGLIGGRLFGVAATLVVLFDMVSYGGASLNPMTDASYFLEPPDTVRFLKQAEPADLYRIFPTNNWVPYPHNVDYALSSLTFNTPSLYGIESIVGEATLPLRRHTDYMMHAIGPAGEAGGLQMLSIANVKYIVTEWTLDDNPDLALVFTGNRQKIFQNLGALPRAFVVHRAEVLDDDAAILSRLADLSFDPASVVILEEEPAGLLPATSPPTPSRVEVVAHKHNRVTIDVGMADTGILVLSDVYYPGWNVYVDDRPSHSYRANYLFRAVEVGAGMHRVEFRYEPLSFRIGLGVTLLSAAMLVIWAAWIKPKTYRRARDSQWMTEVTR